MIKALNLRLGRDVCRGSGAIFWRNVRACGLSLHACFTLEGSELFKGNELGGYVLPLWKINIVGQESDRAETWDAVYQIKTRYTRDILDADFLSWISHYSGWFIREKGRGHSGAAVAAELPRYIEGVVQDGYADRAFLKAEAFRLLDRASRDPQIGENVRQWLWDFVEYAS